MKLMEGGEKSMGRDSGSETPQSIVLWKNSNVVCHATMCFFVLLNHSFCSPLMSEHVALSHNEECK